VNATNAANYDQAKANPYPDYPDALTLKTAIKPSKWWNGFGVFPWGKPSTKVATAKTWWKYRRPEIVEDFEREVIGRVPKNVPKVTWEIVTQATDRVVGDIPVVAKQLVGHVDNSDCPSIKVDIQMTLVTPANVKGPVPVLMMFGGGFGGSGLPRRAGEPAPTGFGGFGGGGFGRGFAGTNALGTNAFPRGGLAAGGGTNASGRGRAGGFGGGGPSSTEMLISNGWGYATINPGSIQDDSGGGRGNSPGGLTRGIIGLVNKGQPRTPEDWGALLAWGWGAGRAFDYLATDPAVDAKHIGIEGVSRYGKAALVTMAFDRRFAMVLVGSSGKGGATPLHRNYGEAVESLTGGEYYWMAGNFIKYGASEASFGSSTPGDIPVDSNELIALCAPRLTFISYGVPDKGDAHWLDHQGSFMATIDANRVFALLGAKTLDIQGDYHTAKMPPVNEGHLDGQLAWRQHDGGHTDAPNMKYFIQWADKFIGHAPPQ
jgi:hypothetical protein